MRKQVFSYNGYNWTLFHADTPKREILDRSTGLYKIFYSLDEDDFESCIVDLSVPTPEMHDGLFRWEMSEFQYEDFIMLAFAGNLDNDIQTILTSLGVDLTGITDSVIVRSL